MISRFLPASLITLCLTTAPAWAASKAIKISDAPPQNHWVPVIIAVLLFVCVAVGSFKSAKRTHQD